MKTNGKGAPSKALQRTAFTWLRAVTMDDRINGKGQVLRLCNSIFLHADSGTGVGWATQQTLGIAAGIDDRSNLRKAKKLLEDLGVIHCGPLADLTHKGKPTAHDPRRMAYRMNLDWAVSFTSGQRGVDPTPLGDEDGVNLTTLCGEINPPDGVDPTSKWGGSNPPISSYLSSSHNDLRNVDEDEIDKLIMDAIDEREDIKLRYVNLRNLRPRLSKLIGDDAFEMWTDRSITWAEIIGGFDGKEEQRKSA